MTVKDTALGPWLAGVGEADVVDCSRSAYATLVPHGGLGDSCETHRRWSGCVI
jgi:hypothetical protein